MKSSIANSISSLPPLPKTILDINRVYADKESGIMDLAKVIEADPMIVANILKTANSPLFSFGKEIRSIPQVVSLFGMSMTRSIALGNSIGKLLNVDMKPYGIGSDDFAEISSMQAKLISSWYSQIDKEKADKLYLAAFLQEIGKIIISNNIIKENVDTSFMSEIIVTNDIAIVEKSYLDVSSSEVTAKVFEHWGFSEEFVNIIKYADNPLLAPNEYVEYATVLNIIKTIIPVNKPLTQQSINFGIRKAINARYQREPLENAINKMLKVINDSAEEAL